MTAQAVVALVVATVLVRLPFLHAPLGRDEGGFLVVASQWHAGSSLYGDYWVDRPPGLLLLFSAADHMGGELPLRLLGVAAAVVSVLAAALLGRLVTSGRRASVVGAAATAAVLVSSRLLDMTEVSGELLAVPLVLLGLCALAVAHARATDGSRPLRVLLPAVLAGVAGVAAVSVKQNFVDVAVAAVPLLAALLGRRRRREAGVLVAGLVLGAAALGGVLLLAAAARGTSPMALWDALVVFRAEAGQVIARHPTPANDARARGLLLAFVLSGAPALLLLLGGLRLRRPHGRLRPWSWACLALLAWGSVVVVLGGSFWWHYLLCLVPGLALLAAVALDAPRPAYRLVLLAPAAVATAIGVGTLLAQPPAREPVTEAAASFLRAEARPGDTATVLYGNPDILRVSQLESPYRYLWSLIVRVRDPELRELSAVLRSPERPTWVVVPARGAASWGVDPRGAARVDRQLAQRYRVAHSFDGLRVLRVARPPAGPGAGPGAGPADARPDRRLG